MTLTLDQQTPSQSGTRTPLVSAQCPSWCAGEHAAQRRNGDGVEHESAATASTMTAGGSNLERHVLQVQLTCWEDEDGLAAPELRMLLPEDGLAVYLPQDQAEALVRLLGTAAQQLEQAAAA